MRLTGVSDRTLENADQVAQVFDVVSVQKSSVAPVVQCFFLSRRWAKDVKDVKDVGGIQFKASFWQLPRSSLLK